MGLYGINRCLNGSGIINLFRSQEPFSRTGYLLKGKKLTVSHHLPGMFSPEMN
jgi:hypothetical protein